jgi:hypothetical protein
LDGDVMTGKSLPRSNEWSELRELEEVGSILLPLVCDIRAGSREPGRSESRRELRVAADIYGKRAP